MASLEMTALPCATCISALYSPYLCTDVCREQHVKIMASQLSAQHFLLPGQAAHDEQGSCLSSVRESTNTQIKRPQHHAGNNNGLLARAGSHDEQGPW